MNWRPPWNLKMCVLAFWKKKTGILTFHSRPSSPRESLAGRARRSDWLEDSEPSSSKRSKQAFCCLVCYIHLSGIQSCILPQVPSSGEARLHWSVKKKKETSERRQTENSLKSHQQQFSHIHVDVVWRWHWDATLCNLNSSTYYTRQM